MASQIIIMTAQDDAEDDFSIPAAPQGDGTLFYNPDYEPEDPIADLENQLAAQPQTVDINALPPQDHTFATIEAATAFCDKWAKDHGYGLRQQGIVWKNKNPASSIKLQQTLIYNRAGPPLARSNRQRERGSDRCNCEFKIKVHFEQDIDLYQVQYFKNKPAFYTHNHQPYEIASKHAKARRIERASHDIASKAATLRAAGVSMTEAFTVLLQQFPSTIITLKDVDNMYQALRIKNQNGYLPAQAMLRSIGDDFHYAYQVNEDDKLERLAFLHRNSIKLLRLYLDLLIIDATYNTNRFGIPLVNIIGMTCTNHSFLVGQAFITQEEEADYN